MGCGDGLVSQCGWVFANSVALKRTKKSTCWLTQIDVTPPGRSSVWHQMAGPPLVAPPTKPRPTLEWVKPRFHHTYHVMSVTTPKNPWNKEVGFPSLIFNNSLSVIFFSLVHSLKATFCSAATDDVVSVATSVVLLYLCKLPIIRVKNQEYNRGTHHGPINKCEAANSRGVKHAAMLR